MFVEVKNATQRDTYQWCVQYQDQSWCNEYDDARPDGRGWAEIGDKPVKALWILAPDLSVGHNVIIPQGATPVFFRRRRAVINLTDEHMSNATLAHCIGWKCGEQATYLFVFDNGSTLLTDDLQAV